MRQISIKIILISFLMTNISSVLALAKSAKNKPAEVLCYNERLLKVLVKQVPKLLRVFDPQTGHFGREIWLSTDQNRMYPLAVAYTYQSQDNAFYQDKKLLEVIIKAGDALIKDADEKGRWVFRKKDGSTWGKIWMSWTYSRWIRSYSLIQDDMPNKTLTLHIDSLTYLELAGPGYHDDTGPAVEIDMVKIREDSRVTVKVRANDKCGIQKVELYCDDKTLGERIIAPYVWSCRPSSGYHTFYAVATDKSPQRNCRKSFLRTIEIP